mmetsp:Transcript_87130/g.247293  ORF Transcript_87130/g.247293 Transcript_87130/m.247293 type:complete len:627 (-) Transcript_87130:23-1903(-)
MMAKPPVVFRKSVLIVSTDEDEFNRCCAAAQTAVKQSGAMCFDHADFACGIREAEKMLQNHSLVAMQSDEVESYHEESAIMMKMLERFKRLTAKYQRMSDEMQRMLWQYIPERVDDFANLRMPHLRARDGLVGDYQAIEMVGHGKFGQIISCQNIKTGKHVILKKMAKSYVNSITSLKRVACELKLLNKASVVPPMMLPIHEMFQTNSHFYYIMDRYGRDVFDFLKLGEHSKRGVGYENAVIIFTSVCEALASLHSLGYAHRDIKSENVLVEYDSRPDGSYIVTGVKVIDLGLACDMEDEMTRYESCGSRGFMAPESLMRRVQNPALSDSWSLACLGLEIILGRQWFTEVWFLFFKEIGLQDDAEAQDSLDFAPLQEVVNIGLDECKRGGTEHQLQTCLTSMLALEPTDRMSITSARDSLRAAYDVPGGQFKHVGAVPSNHLPVISHDAIKTLRGRQQGGMRLESARGSPEGEARGVEGGHDDVASRQTKAQTLPELSRTPASNHNNGRTVPNSAHPPQHSSPSSKRGVEVSPNAGRRTTLSDVTTDDESDNAGRDGAGGRRSVTSSAERTDEQEMDETDECRLSTLSTTNQPSNYYNHTFTNSDSEVDEVPVQRARRGRLVNVIY